MSDVHLRHTMSSENSTFCCCCILWSRSPPLQNSITIYKWPSAERETTVHHIFDSQEMNDVLQYKPSNESLKATMFGCLILDRSTASLLLFFMADSACIALQTLQHLINIRLELIMQNVHYCTFGSRISFITNVSPSFTGRTNRARPKDPSPITLTNEYSSITATRWFFLY